MACKTSDHIPKGVCSSDLWREVKKHAKLSQLVWRFNRIVLAWLVSKNMNHITLHRIVTEGMNNLFGSRPK